ncbi:MAG: TIGR01440 family protein [Oscillospiraceae bacterium]|jgi:uncharacterized protein (TIGR01440 family)|nr:TIGR01440 family protein [Oscillospiraceae bacterium]
MELHEIENAAQSVIDELLAAAKLRAGDIVVVGCSSSEVIGARIGTDSSPEVGRAIYNALAERVKSHGLYLAAQCCEHLNRAIVVERECAERYGLEIVNAVPQPKAGGSFATAAWSEMREPVCVAQIAAHAGLDIGGTLIGMHLRRVAVPVKLTRRTLGDATVIAARTRPPFVGGSRAIYDEGLM